MLLVGLVRLSVALHRAESAETDRIEKRRRGAMGESAFKNNRLQNMAGGNVCASDSEFRRVHKSGESPTITESSQSGVGGMSKVANAHWPRESSD